MRELHYGGGILVVGRDVCTAVFDYALALARSGRSDVINIPILSDGTLADSNLILGPATQIFCTPSRETDAALDDPAKISELRERIGALDKTSLAVVSDVGAFPDFEFEYE
jgi:hypothetical protein